MITTALLSGAIGLLGSIIPDVFKFMQDARDKKHELDMMDRQITMQERGFKYQMDATIVEAESRENVELYKSHLIEHDDWIDRLNRSVRPVIAYMLMTFYCAYKIAAFMVMISTEINLTTFEAVIRLWTEDDMAILSVILGFFYGHRALQKYKKLV